MIFADLDEARRYIEMHRAGATTSFDDTPAIDLIDRLVELGSEEVHEALATVEDEHVEALEEAEQVAATRERERLLGDAAALAAEASVSYLLEALGLAIERERREAVGAARKHLEPELDAARQEAQLQRDRAIAAEKLARGRVARRKSRALAGGGGS